MNAVYVRAYPANSFAVPSITLRAVSHADVKRPETKRTATRDIVVKGHNQGKESLFVVNKKDAGRPQGERGNEIYSSPSSMLSIRADA